MNFVYYDLAFLVLFVAFVSFFLYRNKKNIKRDGMLILYHAGWGIKMIDYVGKKFPRTMKLLSWLSVATGYVLMIVMFYLLGRIVYIYVTFPEAVRAIKVPPITPLIPYLPQVFKIDFLPPFYFTYWIVIIAIIAVSHEFAHGIFAAYERVKVKSTGFGFFPFFLPVFLAAFVELDEKVMAKKDKFKQLAILAGGTFANVLTAILFLGVLFVYFAAAFTPAGVVFDTYPYTTIASSAITSIGGVAVTNVTHEKIVNMTKEEGLTDVETIEGSFVINKQIAEQQSLGESENLFVYYDAPAINVNLERIILSINRESVESIDSLESVLSKYSPGEKVTLEVIGNDDEPYNIDIVLGEHPNEKGKAWLGVGFSAQQQTGVVGKLTSALTSFKKPNTYYEPTFEGSVFIYNLLWWLILISISVALVNMLPMGIFDGGRFFYLTVWAITKNERFARKSFAFATWFLLGMIALLMLLWVFSFSA